MESFYERKQPLIYESKGKQENTLIILHGRGQMPQDIDSLFLETESKRLGGPFSNILQHSKVIFPRAGLRVYTPFEDNQWFECENREDFWITKTCHHKGHRLHTFLIKDIIEAEVVAGIAAEKIALIGLSQGCAQALFTAFAMDLGENSVRLGAVVGISGWLTYADKLEPMLKSKTNHSTGGASPAVQTLQSLCDLTGLPPVPDSTHNLHIPVFVGFGLRDEIVKIEMINRATDVLRMLGCNVELHTYKDLGHGWSGEEIDDILDFLHEHIGLRINV